MYMCIYLKCKAAISQEKKLYINIIYIYDKIIITITIIIIILRIVIIMTAYVQYVTSMQ